VLNLLEKFSPNFKGLKKHANEQAKLVLLASIPCYAITLVAVHLAGATWYLFFFIAIILAMLIAYATIAGRQKADYQLQTLSNLVEALIDGDYTLRGRTQSNPAFQELLELINRLADTLNKHKLKAEESQLLLRKIIDQMEPMLIAINESDDISMINASAKRWLGSEYISSERLSDKILIQLESTSNSEVIQFRQDDLNGEFILFSDNFISENQKHRLFLLTRAEKLLREKERQAWQGLLRVLSHEMNNSLAPITTFSNTLKRKLERENSFEDIEKFKNGLSVISERADSLSNFITSYSQLSHLPPPQKSAYTWQEKIKGLGNLFPNSQFKYSFSGDLPNSIEVDAKQLEQVLINIFKNAQESMQGKDKNLIEVEAKSMDGQLKLLIKDSGMGISNSDNLFIPFYSTKKSGSGIGLVLSQQILLNHEGNLELRNRHDCSGAEAVITLPLFN